MNGVNRSPAEPISWPLLAEPPLQLPDTIQPHGVLLALDPAADTILQVSQNVAMHLGMPPQQLVGAPLTTLLSPTQIAAIRRSAPPPLARPIPLPVTVTTAAGSLACDGFLHQTTTALVLELEPTIATTPSDFLSVHGRVRQTLDQMQQAESSSALLQLVVEAVQQLTGYDRVLICRFDAQGAGEVIAEARQAELSSFLGQRFPATDVPTAVRESYARGKVRAIPHIQAEPVPLFPRQHPPTDEPLDLSRAVLRSSAPCSVTYYTNMGVTAALVLSLCQTQHLWGIVSCHHATPKLLSYEIRAACELITQMAASELANKLRQEDLKQRAKLSALRSELITSITQASNLIDALIQPEERLLTLVAASGAAICLGHELTLIGTTPSADEVRALIQWADQHITEPLFHTACLSQVYSPAAAYKATASGLLLLRISRVQHYLILWFRPEVIQAINWAGNPEAGIQVDESGQIQLGPRTSFALWRETVHATALPWQPFEITGAIDLRNAIVGIVLNKADELGRLNQELQHSNRELTAFAYAAAHDLKEPLRGIYNYANILLEDYTTVLDEEGVEYLLEIQAFTQRMETLINALLRVAQLRQTQVKRQQIDLNPLLAEAVAIVRASRPETSFELRLPRSLPTVSCDPTLINEVFRNLISNAIKYHEGPQRWVEVGYHDRAASRRDQDPQASESELIFYIRDNGIGIQAEHFDEVFKLFKRLHPQERYGDGAGVGLAIVNQIIERHGGRIWVESTPGQGSTFYFTLSEP